MAGITGHCPQSVPRTLTVFLTLFALAGGHICPPLTHVRISVQMHLRAICKNLNFPICDFGKGQYAFNPVKLERRQKNTDILRSG